MKDQMLSNGRHSLVGVGLSLLIALVLGSVMVQTLAANKMAANLDNSVKVVDLNEAFAGQTLQYSIVISNSGDTPAAMVWLTDTLPAELSYISGTLQISVTSGATTTNYSSDLGAVFWQGSLDAGSEAQVSFAAVLTDGVAAGDTVTNTALIQGDGMTITRSAATDIIAYDIVTGLDGSAKTASLAEALPGQSLNYTILISNSSSASTPVLNATDVLPADLMYQTKSLTATVTNGTSISLTAVGDTINWMGTLDGYGFAEIYFVASLSSTLTQGDVVTNVVTISGNSQTITRTTAVNIKDQRSTFLPFISKSMPTPLMKPLFQLGELNSWVVAWNNPPSGSLVYELQEDNNDQFTSPTVYTEQDQLRVFEYPATTNNYFCYRVRAVSTSGIHSDWSETRCVVGNYYDDFSDDSTNWAIRRQDTDDVENSAYYQNGNYVVEIDGRWDYALASPLARAPLPPYSIETTVRLNEQDNLNTYGIIFGGDYDDENAQCPNNRYDTCFNHYYRLMLIWFGGPSQLRLQLKRIDFHYPEDNGGGGETLIPFTDVDVQAPPEGPQTWRIEVQANGKISIFVNDRLLREARDDRYVTSPYFGVFAATNEYSGAEPWFDYYTVEGLPE